MSGSHLSKDFFDLVKSIGESRSKAEEDRIILNEVATLKSKMSSSDVSARRMKEYLIRMIYVEMLGHDASFGHIHAVKTVTSKTMIEKRVGYLAVSLTLNPDHPFMLLLINSLQIDLRSDNFLDVSMALTVVCKLVNQETIPALLPLIVKLLDHKEGQVRKKAIMAIHRFHQIDASTVIPLLPQIRKCLCDTNISVMSATLNILYDLAVARPSGYRDLVPDLVSILKQIIEHRLPRDYDYHRIPAPWIQMQLLKILSVVGANDKGASEGMYQVVRDVMKRSDVGINVGYAIVYECVRTISNIYPEQGLLEEAALAISRFIGSENNNLKYLGVNALAALVQIDSKYAAEHQLLIIDCLNDTDETLKRKTLDLLYSMTNPVNVSVIVDNLITHLRAANDNFLRADLVGRICELAEKFSPSPSSYIQTMSAVFELAAEHVRPDMAENLKRLIAESSIGADDSTDIRSYAVEQFLSVLHSKKVIPSLLLQVIAWVLGEYGHLSSIGILSIMNLLCNLMNERVLDDIQTKSSMLSALLKLSSRYIQSGASALSPAIVSIANRYQSSMSVELQQRAHELLELNKSPNTLRSLFPPSSPLSASLPGSDVVVDSRLSFLDGYVNAALQNGARPYRQREIDAEKLAETKPDNNGKPSLKFTPYASPSASFNDSTSLPFPTSSSPAPVVSFPNASLPSPTASAPASTEPALKLQGVQKKWGPSGYNEPTPVNSSMTQNQNSSSSGPASMNNNYTNSAPVSSQPVSSSSFPVASSSVPSSTSVNVSVKPRRDERLDAARKEKEKLAGALFAGIGGANAFSNTQTINKPAPSAFNNNNRSAASINQMTSAPAPAAASVSAPVVDLLAFADTNPTPAALSTPTTSPHANSLDLLFGSNPSSPPPAASSPAVDPLFAMFDAPINAAPSSAARSSPAPIISASVAPASVSAAPSVSLDPFASLLGVDVKPANNAPAPMMSMASLSASSSSSSSFDGLLGGEVFGASAISPLISSQLSSSPISSSEIVLINDSRIHLSSQRAVGADHSLLLLYASNKTSTPLSSISVSMQLPSGLVAQITGDPAPQMRPAAPGSIAISIPSLSPKSTGTLLIAIAAKDIGFLNSVNANGVLALSGALQFIGQPSPLSFNVALELSDFVRATSGINTQIYGALWKAHADEGKISIRPSSINTSALFMEKIQSLRFFGVQTIGLENICIAKLAGSSPPAAGGPISATSAIFVLVHGKVNAANQSVDLIVRSRSSALSQAIIKLLTAALK